MRLISDKSFEKIHEWKKNILKIECFIDQSGCTYFVPCFDLIPRWRRFRGPAAFQVDCPPPRLPGDSRRHGRAAEDCQDSRDGQHLQLCEDALGRDAKAVQVAALRLRLDRYDMNSSRVLLELFISKSLKHKSKAAVSFLKVSWVTTTPSWRTLFSTLTQGPSCFTTSVKWETRSCSVSWLSRLCRKRKSVICCTLLRFRTSFLVPSWKVNVTFFTGTFFTPFSFIF